MDVGTMRGLAGAAGAIGDGLSAMSQAQFAEQTNAANTAFRVALAKQAAVAASERQQAGFAHTNAIESAKMGQRDTFHAQDLALSQSKAKQDAANDQANLGLRASEVAANNAAKAQSIAESKLKTPAEVAELNARASGIDRLPSGITPVMVATATKEYEQANRDVSDATKVMQKASQHQFTPAQKVAAAAAETTLTQAKARLEEARSRLDMYSGMNQAVATPAAGIAPSAAPDKAWNDARLSVPVGGTYTGPDGGQYVRKK